MNSFQMDNIEYNICTDMIRSGRLSDTSIRLFKARQLELLNSMEEYLKQSKHPSSKKLLNIVKQKIKSRGTI